MFFGKKVGFFSRTRVFLTEKSGGKKHVGRFIIRGE